MSTRARGQTARFHPAGLQGRSWLSRGLRWWLEPWVYWIDARGADGRPSFAKLTGLLSFGLGMHLVFRLWDHWFTEASAAAAHHPSPAELAFLLAFSTFVFGLPFGLKWLMAWAQTRGAGLARTLESAAITEPERLQAMAELEHQRAIIAERRRAGDNEFEVTE